MNLVEKRKTETKSKKQGSKKNVGVFILVSKLSVANPIKKEAIPL